MLDGLVRNALRYARNTTSAMRRLLGINDFRGKKIL